MALTPYRTTTGTEVSKSIALAQGGAIDDRTRVYDPVLRVSRDYQTTAEIIERFPIATHRKFREGALFYVNSGDLQEDGTFESSERTVWWFKNGTEDFDLEEFATGTGGGGSSIAKYDI